jgi:hypothetical protein
MSASGVSLGDFAMPLQKATRDSRDAQNFLCGECLDGGNPPATTQDQTQEKKACGIRSEQP